MKMILGKVTFCYSTQSDIILSHQDIVLLHQKLLGDFFQFLCKVYFCKRYSQMFWNFHESHTAQEFYLFLSFDNKIYYMHYCSKFIMKTWCQIVNYFSFSCVKWFLTILFNLLCIDFMNDILTDCFDLLFKHIECCWPFFILLHHFIRIIFAHCFKFKSQIIYRFK